MLWSYDIEPDDTLQFLTSSFRPCPDQDSCMISYPELRGEGGEDAGTKNNDTACLPLWPRVEQRTDLLELCIHVKEEQMEEEGGRVPDNPEILRSSILS